MYVSGLNMPKIRNIIKKTILKMDMKYILEYGKEFKTNDGINEKRLPFQTVPSFFTTN